MENTSNLLCEYFALFCVSFFISKQNACLSIPLDLKWVFSPKSKRKSKVQGQTTLSYSSFLNVIRIWRLISISNGTTTTTMRMSSLLNATKFYKPETYNVAKWNSELLSVHHRSIIIGHSKFFYFIFFLRFEYFHSTVFFFVVFVLEILKKN